MSTHTDVLEVLSELETKAMSAPEIFEQCKGVKRVDQVSTALSQLFSAGKISRKLTEQDKPKFRYWKAAPSSIVSSEFIKATSPLPAKSNIVFEPHMNTNVQEELAIKNEQPINNQAEEVQTNFRVHYTSDHSLVLYGVASEPVELCKDKLKKLLGFLEAINVAAEI